MDAPHTDPHAALDSPHDTPGTNPGTSRTPTDNPTDTPKKRKDLRPTLTFKGEEFGPEFRTLINKAAERAGMSQAQFVAETLHREAQRIIKGAPDANPIDTPAVPALQTERLDRQERLISDLAEQVRCLVEVQTAAQRASLQATLWARLRGAFGGAVRSARNPQEA
jgi:hypothetical protein